MERVSRPLLDVPGGSPGPFASRAMGMGANVVGLDVLIDGATRYVRTFARGEFYMSTFGAYFKMAHSTSLWTHHPQANNIIGI